MSHSTVLVIGEDPEAMLVPFDEDLEAEPYRDYEDGEAEEHWWVKAVRRGAEDAGWSDRLGEHPTWGVVVQLYSEKYPPDGDGNERLLHDPETDRAYTISTYNPNSRWDWYSLGGRWTGFFTLKAGAGGSTGRPGLWTPPASSGKADQARKGDIDWQAMHDQHALEARTEHREATAALEGLPTLIRWSTVRTEFEGDIAAARAAYHTQPGLEALADAGFWFDDPAADLHLRAPDPEAAYVEAIVARRSLPFAILNSGGWHERGRMGWFGVVRDETDDWEKRAQTLIDAAPDDALFSLYDVHI